MVTQKRCSRCGEMKVLDEFGKHYANKDGLQYYCKACCADYNKRWRKANPDYYRQYNDSRREKRAAYQKRYHNANREARVATMKQWRAENPEKFLASCRKWRANNREKVAAIEQLRRARKADATADGFDIMEVWERDGYTCVYCLSTKDLSIDHIVPVASGGRWTQDNLCVACRRCNSSKGAKDLDEWIQWKAQTKGARR